MPRDTNDNTDIDNEDIDVPADAVENTDDATDDDFDFAGLTDDEIAAINAEDSDDGNDDDIVAGTDDEGSLGDNAAGDDLPSDIAVDEQPTDDPKADMEDADHEAEAETVADKRTAIDTDYEEQHSKLDDLGKQWDEGDISDGAYNAAKARIDRELKRIEIRESELVTKEDAIAERETSKQEKFQSDFTVAVTDFMARPENKAFVEGSPEFAALDNQLGVIAKSMPPGTPFDVLLNKARLAVSSYMAIEPMGKEDKPVDKAVKPDPETMPSISNMPAVVANSNDGNKFGHLDKLDGPALERAIADMSEAQQNEYLAQ